MKPMLRALAAFTFASLPVAALAQEYAPAAPDAQPGAPSAQAPEAAPSEPPPGWDEQYPPDSTDQGGPTVQAEPGYPAEPSPPAVAPGEEAPAVAQDDVPPGEWVWTEQYGWVWMPYADAYTAVPPDGYGEPYMYVYGPTFGWSWLVAPWGLGLRALAALRRVPRARALRVVLAWLVAHAQPLALGSRPA